MSEELPKRHTIMDQKIKINKNPKEYATDQINKSKLDPYFSKRDFNKTKEKKEFGYG